MSLIKSPLPARQSDFKSENFFRTSSITTNLVTSPNKSCSTMLCHFGQSRSSFVFTLFNHFSSTATGSAIREYGAVPERISQNEEPKKEMKNTLSFSAKPLKTKRSKLTGPFFNTKSRTLLYLSYIFRWVLLIFSDYGKSSHLFCLD